MTQDDGPLSARVSYGAGELLEGGVAADPFAQLSAWLEVASAHPEIVEPNAMTLATADERGKPSARIVLLRGCDERGLVFFTNYESRKGCELAANAAAALLFWWGVLQRQVRIEGVAEKLAPEESDAYFASRPRGHRLAAWASAQSRVVADRAELDAAMSAVEARFPDDVPRPPYWGGYRLRPDRFEFWQGRLNRFHDRLAYLPSQDGWRVERLAP